MESEEVYRCALCGEHDHDKNSDHLRYVFKMNQSTFDKALFCPRLYSHEMDRLQRGSSYVCSNRSKCRDRMSIRAKATGCDWRIQAIGSEVHSSSGGKGDDDVRVVGLPITINRRMF